MSFTGFLHMKLQPHSIDLHMVNPEKENLCKDFFRQSFFSVTIIGCNNDLSKQERPSIQLEHLGSGNWHFLSS